MSVKIIAVGKLKESFLQAGIAEYAKRLQPFTTFTIIEVKESNTQDANRDLGQEGELLLAHLKADDYIISLALEGTMMSSPDLAAKIDSVQTYLAKNIVFIIGGSCGLSPAVKAKSDFLLSFGPATYPHQLMRLILTEQIYRAYTIINHQKYHK